MPWGLPATTHDRSLSNPHRNAVFWNGLRVVMSMLIPSVIGVLLGYPEEALLMGLGTLVVGIADTPGTKKHRRITMIIGLGIILLAHTFTVVAQLIPYAINPTIVILTFLLSYIALYGTRAGAIGSSAMLAMIFGLHSGDTWIDVIISPLMIGLGGLAYFLLSIGFMEFRPFRIVQQTLGDCIQNMGEYMKLRSQLYQGNSDKKYIFRKLREKQAEIVEEQENVRELLFKSRSAQRGSNHLARALLMIFSESVDIFEVSITNNFSYFTLADKYKNQHILEIIKHIIYLMSDELYALGVNISTGTSYKQREDLLKHYKHLKLKIKQLEKGQEDEKARIILENVVDQIGLAIHKMQRIIGYNNREFTPDERSLKEMHLHLFTRHQTVEFRPFLSNLTFKSLYFRHALRSAISMSLAIIVGYLLPHYNSYWLLLTVIVIIRPNYSMTKKRMNQRVLGTLIGGAIGFLILSIPNLPITVVITVLIASIWGFFTFNVLNYRTSTIYTTIAVLLGNYLIQPDFMSLLSYRVGDTLIAAFICIATLYLLWPDWEYKNIVDKLKDATEKNLAYFHSLREMRDNTAQFLVQYKLARREAMSANAGLSAAFQRMLQDPKSQQRKSSIIYQIVVLNHAFMSHVASIGTSIRIGKLVSLNHLWFIISNQVENNMEEAIQLLDESIISLSKKDADISSHLIKQLNDLIIDKEPIDVKNFDANKISVDFDESEREQVKLIADQLKFLLDLSRRIAKSIYTYKLQPEVTD